MNRVFRGSNPFYIRLSKISKKFTSLVDLVSLNFPLRETWKSDVQIDYSGHFRKLYHLQNHAESWEKWFRWAILGLLSLLLTRRTYTTQNMSYKIALCQPELKIWTSLRYTTHIIANLTSEHQACYCWTNLHGSSILYCLKQPECTQYI
jgi:hypothetical protein